jgi:hypothetical protein
MGSDASATGTAHPAGAHALERSTFRSTAVSISRSRPMDLLSGFEGPSVCSLFELLDCWWSAPREARREQFVDHGPIAQLARARA